MTKNNHRKIRVGCNGCVFSGSIARIVNFCLNLSARATTRAKAATARRIVKGKGTVTNLVLSEEKERDKK